MKTFGQRIQEARKAKGWTLERTANAVRSHKGYISGIENGKVRAPSPKIVPLLCAKLGLDGAEMAALAWWEKRPRSVTLEATFKLIDNLIAEGQQRTPPGEKDADKKLMDPPAQPQPEAKAV